jgi:hypothetical protein
MLMIQKSRFGGLSLVAHFGPLAPNATGPCFVKRSCARCFWVKRSCLRTERAGMSVFLVPREERPWAPDIWSAGRSARHVGVLKKLRGRRARRGVQVQHIH